MEQQASDNLCRPTTTPREPPFSQPIQTSTERIARTAVAVMAMAGVCRGHRAVA
jgi:hypothetical protein